jgi:hypothetical protein
MELIFEVPTSPMNGHIKACGKECGCSTRNLLLALGLLPEDAELYQSDLVNLVVSFESLNGSRELVLSYLRKFPHSIPTFLDLLRDVEHSAPEQWKGEILWSYVCGKWIRSIVRKFDVWPNHILIEGVEITDHHIGCGASADVFRGRLKNLDVAIKRPRVSPNDKLANDALLSVSTYWCAAATST